MIAALLMLAAGAGDVLHPIVTVQRDFCPERPGLNTPACTIAPGRFQIETSLADWTIDRQGADRTDTVLAADTLVRIGIADAVEARIGWTPFAHRYERGGGTADGVGDVTLGLKANLRHPAGDGLSIAVLPYVTLPVGRSPIGAGDWGGGVLLPVTYELSDAVQLEGTGEVDAAVDENGDGRHLAYSATAGVGVDLTDALTLTGEAQVERDDDPAGHTTQALAALSLAVKAGDHLQFDLSGIAGLNRASPDVELQGGVAVRF